MTRPTCGCQIECAECALEGGYGKNVPHDRIIFCPLHQAAEAMREALQTIIDILPDGNSPSHLKAKAALAQAQGTREGK